ncbi:ATP-binding cassette domain-containing protein [Clostridium saudiense]|uniref:ATP-binding cassette domain-containing protein n=1 Tax=Clostridium saudiense TaxID=1414720 RepID=UPI0018A90F0F|nr:ABC transporter ATP-binding protein [Clostridium saudiense]
MVEFILIYIKKRSIRTILYVLGNFAEVFLQFSIPLQLGIIINNLVYDKCYSNIIQSLIILAVISTFKIVISYINKLNRVNLVNNISFEISMDIIKHLSKCELSFFKKNSSAYLRDRINSDSVSIVTFVIDSIIMMVIYIISAIVLLVGINKINTKITIVYIFSIPIYILIYLYFKKKMYLVNYLLKEASSRYTSVVTDQFNAISFIKYNSLYGIMKNNIKNEYKKLYKATRESTKVSAKLNSVGDGITQYVNIIILFIGFNEVLNGSLEIGYFTILSNYLTYILEITSSMLNFSSIYQTTKASYDRTQELYNISKTIQGIEDIDEIESIDIKNLSFSYKNKKIIDDFTYEFKKNNVYILKGENGSGKSTLIKLITGMENSYFGQININGKNIKTINMNNILKKNITVVEQEPNLLGGELRKLISVINKDINSNRSIELFKKLGLNEEFNINDLIIDNSNSNISGGEKHKIAIFLGILKESNVMILDEPTSALDGESKLLLVELLKEVKKDKIIILISHEKSLDNSMISELNAKKIYIN